MCVVAVIATQYYKTCKSLHLEVRWWRTGGGMVVGQNIDLYIVWKTGLLIMSACYTACIENLFTFNVTKIVYVPILARGRRVARPSFHVSRKKFNIFLLSFVPPT